MRSKSWDEFYGESALHFDFVFTDCDNAAGEVCPYWAGQPMTAHWGVEDPAAVEGTDETTIYIGQIVHKSAVFEGQHPAIIDTELWQAVQDKLRLNRQGHRTRQTSINPSLLTGLVFDEYGNRLTPTHSKKGARRYHYYIDQQYQSESEEKSANILRLPAQELEGAVVHALTGFLKNESRLVKLMGTTEAGRVRYQLQAAAELAQQLLQNNASQKISILQHLVSRITVYKHMLEIVIIRIQEWNRSHVEVVELDEFLTVIEVPVELKRCGMAVRLIVHVPVVSTCRIPDQKLVARIAKAHIWFQHLSSGRCGSIQSIARQ